MIRAGLYQAEKGPRWLITLEAGDKMTPDALAKLCAEGRMRTGIYRCILQWTMKGGQLKGTFPIDMRDVELDPEMVLLSVASSFVRSAYKMGAEAQLPDQFFGGEVAVLDEQGRPVPVAKATNEQLRVSPVHPNYRPPVEPDHENEVDKVLRSIRDAKH